MPTYEYLCTTCGRRFDVMQSMKDEPLTHCPEDVCTHDPKGKGAVQRMITGGSGVIYKGDGFYLTDYTKKSGSNE
jgi:putative FmdB family regulatory protein